MQLYFPMSFSPSAPLHLRRPSLPRLSALSLPPSASFETAAMTAEANKRILSYEEGKEKIKEMFRKVELSASAYDTAWVAMVPLENASEKPCYPESLKWIMENQHEDGSWGLPDSSPLLVKDAILSTLACVIALKRWQVGEEQVTKGLDFIKSSFGSVMDENLHSPTGFDIIFPSMIECAFQMAINLHLDQRDLQVLVFKRDMELRRIRRENSDAKNVYLSYISEVFGKFHDWEMVLNYKKKNGSLFNTPSTTAAALFYINDQGCRSYLDSLFQQFGNAVPAVYPLDIYARLHLVDMIQNLGIERHFIRNIKAVLDETFRRWMQGDEEIFGDVATCSIAFRLLRTHGYDVSSEPLAVYGKGEFIFNKFGGDLKDISDALELFRASQMIIHADEQLLRDQNSHSQIFLNQILSDQSDQFSKHIVQEAHDALENPYHSTLDRLAARKYIEHYNLDGTKIHKTAYRFENICNEVLLRFAVQDFNYCQSIHIDELRRLKRWLVENKLDQLTFSRQKLGYCYFSGAATMFSPGFADARLSWAKNGVLTTVVDDFFDVGSTREEQLNLIKLFVKWDAYEAVGYCSENVKIVFSALRSSICEIANAAYAWQDRNVIDHIVDVWLDLIKSMWVESEMTRNKSMPTFEEYMKNGYVSFALGPIVLPALYFVSPNLSEKIVKSDEYHKLYELMSTSGRLLNDVRGFQREMSQGKLNAVAVHWHHQNNRKSKEETTSELMSMAEANRIELLRLVLDDNEGLVPRDCKEIFLKMSKVLQTFYKENDGFTGEDIQILVKSVLQDPIALS